MGSHKTYMQTGYENKCYHPFPAPRVSPLKILSAQRESSIGKKSTTPS